MEQVLRLEGSRARQGKWRVLMAVLLLVFPILAFLVREQGRVIDTQRMLIQQLFGDSQELNAMRVRDLNNKRKSQATPAPTPSAPSEKPQEGAGSKPEQKKRAGRERRPEAPQEYPASRPTLLSRRKAA